MNTETLPETPLMKQYASVKASYPHAMLFFRLGDFYEMFNDDARTANKVLGLVLTSRQGVPMCGVPHHSCASYISKLLRAGHKVAICEQMGSENTRSKGLFKREVIRLITPGTVLEDELLDARVSNHLVSIETEVVGWGLACVEVSTGEFWATQSLRDPGFRILTSLLAKLNPSEIIAQPKTGAELKSLNLLSENAAVTYLSRDPGPLEPPENWPSRAIWSNRQLALKAALKAAAYVAENTPGLKGTLAASYREPNIHMQLDENAIRTLELVESPFGDRSQTLWGTLDHTRTAMGSRMLKNWILQPLTEPAEIERRQFCIAELVDNNSERETLGEILGEIADVERIVSRIAAQSAGPKDVAAVRKSLEQFAGLKEWIEKPKLSSALAETAVRMSDVSDEIENVKILLARALSDNPPFRVSDGGVIREGYNAELDELRNLRKNSRDTLNELCEREKQATGIPTLKAGYNSVFGYYLEATKSNLSKIPPHYIRKQTLANNERYITQELKELESKILGAEERISSLESHLFSELRARLVQSLPALRKFASCAAELDVYYALAYSAVRGDYVRPEVDLSSDLFIEDGRHPVVEQLLAAGSFVPNSIEADSASRQIMVITGPNMSGKSVYLRQNAVIVIMAQMGSFVPAKSARVGIVDRIMTRIGAQDALARGESTFMVEMKETANILRSITPRSLVLLDEIGRGTSTFDGISIAWAVIEYLFRPDGGAKVLFATHYFELTELADKLSGVKNFNVQVKEWTNSSGRTEVVFLHKIAPGPADKSYGIHVAELAGLPSETVLRAKKILETLERRLEPSGKENEKEAEPMLPLFSCHPILDEIRMTSPEKLTPLDALALINEWKKRL